MEEGSGGMDDCINKEPFVPETRPYSSLSCTSSYLENRGPEDSDLCHGLEEPRPLWRPSTRYIDPGFGFEKQWRSSRAKVLGAGDSHLERAGTPAAIEEWKSSIRYINPGTGAWSDGWKPSIKPITPHCSHTEQWKPSVRVFKLQECGTEWKMSGGRRHVPAFTQAEPFWRSCRSPGNPPVSKWAPPFRNLNVPIPKRNPCRKRVVYYVVKHPPLQLFSTEAGIGAATGLNSKSLTMPIVKQIRQKVNAYFKQHPPLHLFSNYPLTGSDVEELSADSMYCPKRRYIPEGRKHHFENPGCVVKGSTLLPLGPKTISQKVKGRNVITGEIGPLDEARPPSVKLGPSLLAPAGNYYRDVIDHRFGNQQEIEDEIPSYCSQFYREAYNYAHKGYKRNCLSGCHTDPSFKDYLYEVKDATPD